ncbi:EamA/RhaT family transporter, partial [Mesorhizobium sp. M7A.F.Ca.ET.027.03.2.1]
AILVDVVAFGHRLHLSQVVGATAILIAAAGMNLGWTLWKGKPPVASPHPIK